MKNLFYFSLLNSIGGIEQYFAYLSEKYKDWDITIVYRRADPKQLARLRKYVKTEKYSGQYFECDKAFFCFNSDIKDHINAKETALVLHGDYKTMLEQGQLSRSNPIFDLKFDKYYGVSQVVCDAWTQITKNPCVLVYNPFVSYPTKKYVRIVYCGRLTEEKGGDLAIKLIDRMDERGIDYQFYVYSDKTSITGNHVIYLGTRLDAGQFLNPDTYDFIIVPSKNEGYCYSLIQALDNGLPAIVTPCPVFKELGVNETNSIQLEFDGSNIDSVIDDMLSKSFKFSYTPMNDTWDKILAPGTTTYEYAPVVVEATCKYFDCELNQQMYTGIQFEVTQNRANELLTANVVKLVKEK